MRLSKYSTAELLEIQRSITKEIHDRHQLSPDADYLETVSAIGVKGNVNKDIELSTITGPIRLSHWSTNNLDVVQTVEKINEVEYLIKTTEYDECEDSDPDHYDEDDNFITQEKVLSTYYVSLPLLQAFIEYILK